MALVGYRRQVASLVPNYRFYSSQIAYVPLIVVETPISGLCTHTAQICRLLRPLWSPHIAGYRKSIFA